MCLSSDVAADEFYSMLVLHDSQSVPIGPPADFLLLPAVRAID